MPSLADINFVQVEPTNVAISGKVVTLTLPQSVAGNDMMSLSYTAPAANAIQNTGGVEADSFTDIEVDAITANNRPEAANGEVDVDEDGIYSFDRADFGYTDADGDAFVIVRVNTLPDKGTLVIKTQDFSVKPADLVTAAELDADQFTYTPVADENGDDYASFEFNVFDSTHLSRVYTMTINVNPVNDAPTGAPVIVGEMAQEGQMVLVDASSIADVDGLPGSYTYQWFRVDDQGTETEIMDVTTDEYTLQTEDVDHKLKVRASFTDDGGTDEMLDSELWPSDSFIEALPPPPPLVEEEEEEEEEPVTEPEQPVDPEVPTEDEMEMPTLMIDRMPGEREGRFTVTFTFSAPVFGFSQQDIVAENAEISQFMGEDGGTVYTVMVMPTGAGIVTIEVATGVANSERGMDNEGAEKTVYTPPPPAPPAPELELPEDGSTALVATWRALPTEYCPGCPHIARYELQYQRGSGPDWLDVAVPVAEEGLTWLTTIPLPDLANDYRVRVRAVNTDGVAGEWSEPGEWEMPDEFLPMKDRSIKAWHVHFGRTVGTQVLEAVSNRLVDDKVPFLKVAGINLGENMDLEEKVQQWVVDLEEGGSLPALPEIDSALKNSAFSLRHKSWGAFGHVARDTFEGKTLGVDIDGDVITGMLGMDWNWGAWTQGMLFSRSEGDGDYRGESTGRVESKVVGAWPYGRYQVTERFSLWGVAGYGRGDMKFMPEGEDTMRANTDLVMGALGARGIAREAPEDGGLQLAITSDAMTVRSSSESVAELTSSRADVSRLRLGIEGSWQGLEGWTPGIEVGIRHDDGDAESGYGVDIGTSLAFADAEGTLSGQVRARGLITHEDGGLEQFGVSGTLAWDPKPSSQRGPSLTLSHSMGASAFGGMSALLEQANMTSLPQEGKAVHLQLKAGYGMGLQGGRYVLLTELGLGQAPHQQDYELGVRMDMISRKLGGFEIDLRGQRVEHDQADPEHQVRLQVAVRY